jgi:hypothetical protein
MCVFKNPVSGESGESCESGESGESCESGDNFEGKFSISRIKYFS